MTPSRIGNRCRAWWPQAAVFVLLVSRAAGWAAADETGFEPRPLSRIPPGTTVLVQPEDDAARVLLFVKGRLAAGDTEMVTDTMRYYSDLFNLVYTASVRPADDGGYRLADVAVGFATTIKDRATVITSESAGRLGAGLSLIGSTVLADNEAALGGIMLTAHDRCSAVIDAPSVVRIEDQNRKMTVRFFVWVAEQDGRLGTAAWLLRPTPQGSEFVEDSFQFLPPGTVEDRVMHVDKSRFLLGLPTAEAFAMVSIPRGREFPLTARLKAIGNRPRFDHDSLAELTASLAEALAAPADR